MEKIEQTGDQSFSCSRFWELAKTDFILNKSNYVKYAIAIIGCYVALAGIISFNAVAQMRNIRGVAGMMPDAIPMIKSNYSAMLFFMSLFLFALFLTIKGSQTFSNLSDKKHRISALMIPASMSEKFVMRMFVYLGCGTLLSLLGVFIGFLIGQFSFGGGSFMLEQCDDFLSKEYGPYIVAIIGLFMLFQNALFSLGSALWPKLSWVKTWIVLTVIQWIFGLLMVVVSMLHIDWLAFNEFMQNQKPESLFWCGIIVEIILIAACWICAWLRFRSTQIVQRFMKK